MITVPSVLVPIYIDINLSFGLPYQYLVENFVL